MCLTSVSKTAARAAITPSASLQRFRTVPSAMQQEQRPRGGGGSDGRTVGAGAGGSVACRPRPPPQQQKAGAGAAGNAARRRPSQQERRQDCRPGEECGPPTAPQQQSKPVKQVQFQRAFPQKGTVAIIGGGVSGLVCAQELADRGIRSVVLDTGEC